MGDSVSQSPLNMPSRGLSSGEASRRLLECGPEQDTCTERRNNMPVLQPSTQEP